MANITASMVKDLREKTGAGMMDAKKALVENNGDVEQAIDWLRTKGLAKAAKKSSRTAAEGLVAVVTGGAVGAVVEVNSETDFVARNEEFQGFVQQAAQKALEASDVEAFKAADYGNGKSIQDQITDLIAKIGENMNIRRMEKLEVSKGAVTSYVHGALAPGLGKIGVLVGLESDADVSTLEALGKQIAMHIAAANPASLNVESLDPDMLDREKAVLKEQAIASGKPAEIAEKMVEGRLRKYYEEVVLLEQVFVIDGETKISAVIENAAKEAGSPIKLTGFVRLQLGDGIEIEEGDDFATEVAKTANG